MKNELQNIISGKSHVRLGDTIQTISNYVKKSKSSSGTFETSKQIKSEEATLIKKFCTFGFRCLIKSLYLLFPNFLKPQNAVGKQNST